MGTQWDYEDPHCGPGQTPKLTLVGRLEGSLDGRPVSLVGENRDLTLRADDFRTLLTLRRWGNSASRPLFAALARADLRIFVRFGRIGAVEVFPNPTPLVGLIFKRG